MRLLPALLLLGLASGAVAQTKTFTVELNGSERTPTVATDGTGTATVVVDTSTGAVTVTGTYKTLTTPVTDVHIHGTARRGVNSGVFVGLIPTGGVEGTFSGGGTLNPSQLQDMLAGLTYINVHSMMHGGGEIRGQIDDVPDSGHPSAQPVFVTGEAKPGGTLRAGCSLGTGTHFVLIGLAMPPCVSVPLNIPEMCLPGPANVAIDLSVPPIVFPGRVVNITFPVPFPAIDLTIQCATITPSNCVTLSAARRIAIRP